jgi:COMM domain containing 4
MRFRFCGDLDCPDWVLAEIATLSKLTSVRMKILVAQTILHCVNGSFNYEKVSKLVSTEESDGVSDLKGAIAAVNFIVFNAAKHDLDDASLIQEIQQLGLPKENSEAIGKLFKEKKDEMRDQLASESYSIAKVLKCDWRIDGVIATSEEPAPLESVAHLKFVVDTRPQDSVIENGLSTDGKGVVVDGYRVKELAFECSSENIDLLVHELGRAEAVLDSLEA